MEWKIEQRPRNGINAMVIDLDKYTRCDDCMRACAASHGGNPRFVCHGKIHDRWMVVNACMHCFDPVCMIGCPTAAIHRSPAKRTVLVNDDTCIGCDTCADSCPDNNISPVEIMDWSGRKIMTVIPVARSRRPRSATCAAACPRGRLPA